MLGCKMPPAASSHLATCRCWPRGPALAATSCAAVPTPSAELQPMKHKHEAPSQPSAAVAPCHHGGRRPIPILPSLGALVNRCLGLRICWFGAGIQFRELGKDAERMSAERPRDRSIDEREESWRLGDRFVGWWAFWAGLVGEFKPNTICICV